MYHVSKLYIRFSGSSLLNSNNESNELNNLPNQTIELDEVTNYEFIELHTP